MVEFYLFLHRVDIPAGDKTLMVSQDQMDLKT